MIGFSLINYWWANNSMQSTDMEAPFVASFMGFCLFLPMGFACFVIAVLSGLWNLVARQENKGGEIDKTSWADH